MTSSTKADALNTAHAGLPHGHLRLRCPSCRKSETLLDDVTTVEWPCPTCGFRLRADGGILVGLTPERQRFYAKFAKEYLTIRKAEGRGSEDPGYYLALPDQDLSGRLAAQWAMRAKTYRYLERKLLPRWERFIPGGLDVLDLGAGTGWMSYRLALRGHHPVAVDLLDDPVDGLGAAQHYFPALSRPFARLQAEFDSLPLADAQFDLAIFNASFHYSVDYQRTLREVRRCLKWTGRLVILETPVYRQWSHGEQMRDERHRQFEAQYGFRSDSVPSMEYLDHAMLATLQEDLNLRWQVYRPWYGWKWHLRPWRARLARRRPPSRFWILVGSWERP